MFLYSLCLKKLNYLDKTMLGQHATLFTKSNTGGIGVRVICLFLLKIIKCPQCAILVLPIIGSAAVLGVVSAGSLHLLL